MSEIHPQAIVSPKARLGRGCRIGPFAVVGDDVDLGEGCVLHAHAIIQGPTRIGRGNTFHSFSVVGGDPQDLKFAGERTELEMGDGNTFREFVTVNRGTQKGGGATRIGSNSLFLAYTHIGHDGQVGSHTLFSNAATLAGHVTVEDYATISAFSAVHQFCRVGRYAYVGGYTVVTKDVPPYSLVVTKRDTRCYGANSIGLERSGFSAERIKLIEQAFRLLLRSKLNTTQALEKMRETLAGSEDVLELMRFIESAERGLTK